MRRIIAFAAAVEVGAGAALIVVPSISLTLLAGPNVVDHPVPLGRVCGTVLLALGIACWPRRQRVESASAAFRALLTYNALVAPSLACLGVAGYLNGPLLWPGVALHAVVASLLVWAWRHERRTVLPLLTVVLALCGIPARAGDTRTEMWPEAQGFFKLGEQLRLHLLADAWYAPASWTPDGTASESEAETGVHLDFTLKPRFRPKLRTTNWERERYIWARVGYDYLWTPGDPAEPSHESRGIVELTARAPFGDGFSAVNRVRADLRDKNGSHSTRYRERLLFERETPIFGLETVPYLSTEILYDTRYDAWSEQRYQAGLEMVLHESWRLEPYLLHQEDTRSKPEHANALGLIVKYYH
jgi:Protein of unknown function (DUF2490)